MLEVITNKPLWVNPRHINIMYTQEGVTYISFTMYGKEVTYMVKETPEQINNMLNKELE